MPCAPGEIARPNQEVDGAMRCIPSRLTVEFRPYQGYHGEFGFDWLRTNDGNGEGVRQINQLDGVGSYPEVPYIDVIYVNNLNQAKMDQAKDKPEQIEIKKDAANPITSYRLLKKKYPSFELIDFKRNGQSDSGSDYDGLRYFIPTLALFSEDTSKKLEESEGLKENPPPFEAKLRLLFYAQGDSAQTVIFEFPDNITINGDASGQYTWKNTDDYEPLGIDVEANVASKEPFVIKCIKDISEVIYIDVKAKFEFKNELQLVGRLRILPNTKDYYQIKDIELVELITNSTGKLVEIGEINPDTSRKELTVLYNTLYQSLVVPRIKKTEMFLTEADPDYIANGLLTPHQGRKIDACSYLKNEYNVTNPDAFIVFITGLGFNAGKDSNGYTNRVDRVSVLSKKRSSSTMAHEVLHIFGLDHTHVEDNTGNALTDARYREGGAEFYYKYGSTDNIMSYEGTNFTTWSSQWRIINSKFKEVIKEKEDDNAK